LPFLVCRALRRTTVPALPSRPSGILALAAVHAVLLLAEIVITFVLASELFCLEPASEAGAPGPRVNAMRLLQVVDPAAPAECNYIPFAIFFSVPPAAAVLPPILGLAALAAQSSRGLRMYASWNGASLWSAGVSLVVVFAHLDVLPLYAIALPLALTIAKLASAQCVPWQLAEIEATRAVRGWRGLYEVRHGAQERTMRTLGRPS